jgi:hypothetical protein
VIAIPARVPTGEVFERFAPKREHVPAHTLPDPASQRQVAAALVAREQVAGLDPAVAVAVSVQVEVDLVWRDQRRHRSAGVTCEGGSQASGRNPSAATLPTAFGNFPKITLDRFFELASEPSQSASENAP